MLGTKTKKILDLRYNEMCKDWSDVVENSCEPEIQRQRHHLGRLVLSWKQLDVWVQNTTLKLFEPSETTYKQILYNVSGNIQCGTLLGIMGPSGSGKTTLMATISHRTKGNFSGELYLNGNPVSEDVMIKISGFVPQNDINFEQLTVTEHLVLMANLKMDRDTTKAAQKDRVDYIINTLGMSKILNTRLSFLSGGERKKVALAVQLLNDPPILFCDEITTGLDSYSASLIINILKRIARTGKIVICTIHQPASGVFDKFDEIVLLSNGRLVYQGPVSMVNELFQKFNYKCPDLYNKADFVISVLNSDDENAKRNVDEMSRLSSTDKEMNLNYNLFNDERQMDYQQHLQSRKPLWITQLQLVLYRSVLCTIRNYKVKLLELITLALLGVILSIPYINVVFDTKAVQNWQGFWFSLVTNSIFQFCYTSIITHQVEFLVVHREVSNHIYALSVYYISQIVVSFIWTVLESLVYIYLVFWIVGIQWQKLVVTTFVIHMLVSRSYGSALSAFFEKFDHIVLFSVTYDYLGVALSGAYLSLGTLSPVLSALKHFSIFFLGCETLSILQWENIEFIPCFNVDNCLHNGKEVLLSYGYNINNFHTDLMFLVLFYVVLYVVGYYGLYRRIKKQPAY